MRALGFAGELAAIAGVGDEQQLCGLHPRRVVDALQYRPQQAEVGLQDDDDPRRTEPLGQRPNVIPRSEAKDDDDRVLHEIDLLGEPCGLVERAVAAAQRRRPDRHAEDPLGRVVEDHVATRLDRVELLAEFRVALPQAAEVGRQG